MNEFDPNLRSEFKYASGRLLTSNDQKSHERACAELRSLLKEIVPPSLFDTGRKDRITSYGRALSPESAAGCLWDETRTAKFAQGLYLAIRKALEIFSERPLRVLEAGSGPYALLSMLVAPFFKNGEVEFTALDIHEVSATCARRLASCLGESGKFRFETADATTFTPESLRPHVTVAEVMGQLLQSEPQVQTTANLGDQTVEGGFFLPEEVEIGVDLEGKGEGRDRERIKLGTIYRLTRDIASRVKIDGKVDPERLARELRPMRTLIAPRQFSGQDEVIFTTRIRVFGDAVIGENESDSLTFDRPLFAPLPEGIFSKADAGLVLGDAQDVTLEFSPA